MLQNPFWDRPQKTEADICLADFIEWLETKDPQEEYNFTDLGSCAVVQYSTARGIRPYTGQYTGVCRKLFGGDYHRYAISVLAGDDQTFGAILNMAKSLQQGERK